MSYDDLKQTILRKIDTWRDKVKQMIDKAKDCDDWQEIRDEITFMIEGYGSIMMIDRLEDAAKKFDEEEKAKCQSDTQKTEESSTQD